MLIEMLSIVDRVINYESNKEYIDIYLYMKTLYNKGEFTGQLL